MAKTPDIDEDNIDTGPLTLEQLQGLAADQIEAVRATAMLLWQDHGVACDILVLDRLEHQLCK